MPWLVAVGRGMGWWRPYSGLVPMSAEDPHGRERPEVSRLPARAGGGVLGRRHAGVVALREGS